MSQGPSSRCVGWLVSVLLVAFLTTGCSGSITSDTSPSTPVSWTYSAEELHQAEAAAFYLSATNRTMDQVDVMELYASAHGFCGGTECTDLTIKGVTVRGTRGKKVQDVMIIVHTAKGNEYTYDKETGKVFVVAAIEKVNEIAHKGGPPIKVPELKMTDSKGNP